MEPSGEVAFEAAQRAFCGLAFGLFAGEVFTGGGVVLRAGDRDDVQRVVELAVPSAVEAMLLALARGAFDRRGAALQREARVGVKPFGSGGSADQDRGGERPAAGL